MTPFPLWPARRLLGIVLGLVVAGLPLPARAAKFWAASVGPVTIYTSDSPEGTREFLCEILEVRRQIQELVAPVPLPNPRFQLVVFNKLKDYEDFAPPGGLGAPFQTKVSGFTAGEYGLTAAVVNEGGLAATFGRDVVLYYYARYLLGCVLPDAPIWIASGLPEVLAATKFRRDKLYIGGDFMEHQSSIRPAKLIPLARLMDDREMKPFAGVATHDNVLYHESWALWQNWLTAAGPQRREQVRRLLAAIRDGAPGNFDQVAESFGETKEAIEAVHRSRKPFAVVVSQTDPASLAPGLSFQPATALDGKFALAMVLAGARKEQGAYAYELRQQAAAHPESPRPLEALAVIAMMAGEPGGATGKWAQARELGTDNPFAYLLPARDGLRSRQFYFTLRAQLPDAVADPLRGWLDRCVQLDPGNADAHYYRVLLEAFATQPDKAAVDAAEGSHTLVLRPMGWFYAAIARWRLGDTQEAHRLLEHLRQHPGLSASIQKLIDQLQTAMKVEEKKAASSGD